jgi:hypothetical protein
MIVGVIQHLEVGVSTRKPSEATASDKTTEGVMEDQLLRIHHHSFL